MLDRYTGSRTLGDISRSLDPVLKVSLDHRVNQNLNYNFSVTRSPHQGVGTNRYATDDFIWSPTYQISESLNGRAMVDFQHVTESGPLGETGSRRIYSLELNRSMRSMGSISLSWMHVAKDSTLAARVYNQDRVTVSVRKEL